MGYDISMKTPDSVPPPLSRIEELKFDFGIGVHEKHGQDSCLSLPEFGLFAVCDGVSGPGGETASQMAIEALRERALETENLGEEDTIKKLLEIIGEAHNKISSEKLPATTLALAKFIGNKLIIISIGDSRAYELGEKLEKITEDDNLAPTDFLERFDIAASRTDFTEEENENFKHLVRRMDVLTQAVGAQINEPHIYIREVREGYRYLLSSDGLTNLNRGEIEKILKENRSAQIAAIKLIDSAEKRSRGDSFRAKPDDITALVIEPK